MGLSLIKLCQTHSKEMEVIFENIERKITIQSNLDEQMGDIIEKFEEKIQHKESLLYLYQGEKIKSEKKLEDIISQLDKQNKSMKILVQTIKKTNLNINNFVKPKYIVCPECNEKARMKIEDYKIHIFDCINNHDKTILLDEFNNKLDISKIKCNNCDNNKSKTHDKLFYKCFNCNINLCPLCKSTHDNKHSIINYDLKDYICNQHNKEYIKYCKECKLNLSNKMELLW